MVRWWWGPRGAGEELRRWYLVLRGTLIGVAANRAYPRGRGFLPRMAERRRKGGLSLTSSTGSSPSGETTDLLHPMMAPIAGRQRHGGGGL